jgi:hypothetical protein
VAHGRDAQRISQATLPIGLLTGDNDMERRLGNNLRSLLA